MMKTLLSGIITLAFLTQNIAFASSPVEIAENNKAQAQNDIEAQREILKNVSSKVEDLRQELLQLAAQGTSQVMQKTNKYSYHIVAGTLGLFGVSLVASLFKSSRIAARIVPYALGTAGASLVLTTLYSALDTLTQKKIDPMALNIKLAEVDRQLSGLLESTRDVSTRLKISALRDNLSYVNIQADYQTRKTEGRAIYASSGFLITLAAAAPLYVVKNKTIATSLSAILGTVAYLLDVKSLTKRQDVLDLIGALTKIQESIHTAAAELN